MRRSLLIMTALALLAGGCAEHKASPESTPTASAIPKTIRTKTGIEMALIPAGECTLGDNRGERDERPAHRVRLAAFYMDVCEVTQASFQAILGGHCRFPIIPAHDLYHCLICRILPGDREQY